MNSEHKLHITGLTICGLIIGAGAIVVALFFKEMSLTTLMGESPKYRPNFPAVPVTDITQAPQCAQGYDKSWIGCQKLAQ